MIREHNGLMRADRLLSILLILQIRGRVTSRQLAERLEVSERTIHRDMEALTAAGVPVYAERGSRGGWRLLEDYRTDLTGLKPGEVQALLVGQPNRLLEDLGLSRASEGAWIKLLASLPALYRREAESVRGRIYIEPRGAAEPVPHLPTLLEALWRNRKLHAIYRRNDGKISERLLDPLGLVAKGSTWYLVAWNGDDYRTYRVSRVQEARLSLEPAIRPPDFDLQSFWERSQTELKEQLPRYDVRVRVEQKALERFGLMGRWARLLRAAPVEEGWLEAQIRFEVEEDALAWVLSLGPKVRVLEPIGLRAKVIEAVRAILEACVPLRESSEGAG